MCGIAGILHYNPHQPEEWRIHKMTDAMSHRGPDAHGYYSDQHIELGHRRLSIIDLNWSSNQPMFDHSEKFVIIFNGEIFNYQDLRKKLAHYRFRTNSDTEVILAAYQTWGVEFANYLEGMFAFAIWDIEKKELLLCRDRLGVRPFYFHIGNEYMVFASEIRAILASGLVSPTLNRSAVSDMLSFQSISFPISIIKGINQLEAGCIMTIREGKINKFKYWNLFKNGIEIDPHDKLAVEKKIHQLLRKSVERRLVSDVPVGTFLSGGIDSAAIVGLVAEVSTERQQTFNVAFSETDFDESSYADLVAKKFNTRHHKISLQPKYLLNMLPEALDSMDTPSGDGINIYIVSKAVKQHGLKVALTGAGGDELFCGYPFFRRYLQYRRFEGAMGRTVWFRKQMAKVLQNVAVGQAERIIQLVTTARCSIDKFYPECRRILTPNRLQQLTVFETNFDSLTGWQLYKHREEISTMPLLSQVSAADLLGYTQNTLMKDNDQMSMAVSIELRQPFFDHELVEFVLAIPDKFKYPVTPKKLLVDSLGSLIPSAVINRPKQGFVFPWHYWMKTSLRTFCEHYLQRISQRDFIRGNELMKYWNRFLRGDTSIRWMELWLFVVMEYWLEKNRVN